MDLLRKKVEDKLKAYRASLAKNEQALVNFEAVLADVEAVISKARMAIEKDKNLVYEYEDLLRDTADTVKVVEATEAENTTTIPQQGKSKKGSFSYTLPNGKVVHKQKHHQTFTSAVLFILNQSRMDAKVILGLFPRVFRTTPYPDAYNGFGWKEIYTHCNYGGEYKAELINRMARKLNVDVTATYIAKEKSSAAQLKLKED